MTGSDFDKVGDIFSADRNGERKKPFDMRSVMRSVTDADHVPFERWARWRDADGAIVWEAARRFAHPVEGRSGLMLLVAAVGLVANVVTLRLLHRGHAHSLNLRAAYLHVLGDLLGSVGALLAGGVIALTAWTPADPIVSIVIALLILASAWRVLRDSVDVLLEATPRHISLARVETALETIPGLSSVHDLHVWTVTSGVVAMTGHAVVDDPTRSADILALVEHRMTDLGIHHVTVQLETEPGCRQTTSV